MVAYQARDEQFGADAVGFGEAEGVVDEESVTDWLVDYAVEDVC